MRISHNWLKRYIRHSLAPEKLASGLSMLGLEVESFEDQKRTYEKFVVGEVREVAKHPKADKLTVCRVDIGSEVLQIVCGAPNVAAGQKVPVGLVGATVPHDQHSASGEPFVLDRVAIRGVESVGMICSAYELGVGDDADGILVLEPGARVGTALAKAIGKDDVVYEIETTANRGDWLGYFGIAREASALTGKPWTKPAVRLKETRTPAGKAARVRIEDRKGCPRYSARVVFNVKVGPSPRWMQDLLEAVGIRPINNIVDVTNFVLMETGHPIHAFDYDTLEGHEIVVRCARQGEAFTTLDGKVRTLRSDTLMICDAKRPVAVAGVMGGANTEISDRTTNVLIESAFFDPVSIRKTSKYLGLSTDASQRFERAADVSMTVYAAERAAQLMQELAGGEVLRGTIDVYPGKRKPRVVRLRVSRSNAVLGTDLTRAQAQIYLKRLGFAMKAFGKDVLQVTIPTFRNDVQEEIDLIEEVARVHGYDKIATQTETRLDFGSVRAQADLRRELRSYLLGAGFNEVIACSLQSKELAGLEGERAVEVLNPVSTEMRALRTGLIPGALAVIRHNLNQNRRDFRFFEIGKAYRRTGENLESLEAFDEEERLLIVMSGMVGPAQYGVDHRSLDLLDLKGEVEALASKFSLDKVRFVCYDNGKPLSADNLSIEIHGTYGGYLGKVKKEILDRFDIGQEVFVCEVLLERLRQAWSGERRFSALPRFPSVTRDLAFVVTEDVRYGALEEVLREAGGSLVAGVTLFDVFTGQQVGPGKKSLAVTVVLQPRDRTLTDTEANAVVDRMVKAAGAACGAVLRGEE